MNDMEIYEMPKALQAFGSEMVVREALNTYLKEINEMLARVEAALNAEDRQALAKAAHWLRGGLSFLHAPRLKLACMKFDSRVGAQDSIAAIRQELDNLRLESDRLSDYLRAFLVGNAP